MKYIGLICFILIAEYANAQFQPRKYVHQAKNGIQETISIIPEMDKEGQYVTTNVFYQSSNQSQKIKLIVVNTAKPAKDELYRLKFPSNPKLYILKAATAPDRIICVNPDGTKQIFLEEIDQENFITFVCENKNGITERLYVHFLFAVGSWHIIEYNSSRNAQRIRLEIVGYKDYGNVEVIFPDNRQKVYVLKYHHSNQGLEFDTISCTNPDGSVQYFKPKYDK